MYSLNFSSYCKVENVPKRRLVLNNQESLKVNLPSARKGVFPANATDSLGKIIETLKKVETLKVKRKQDYQAIKPSLELINRCVTKHNNSGLKTFLKILFLPWVFATLFNLDFFKHFNRVNEEMGIEVKFCKKSNKNDIKIEQEFFDHFMPINFKLIIFFLKSKFCSHTSS